MTRQELADHISKQMEESAQMGEPPSFAFENVTDAAQLLRILRSGCAGPEQAAVARWTFFATSPQTALMLGTKLDPFDKSVDWLAECNRLADEQITHCGATSQSVPE